MPRAVLLAFFDPGSVLLDVATRTHSHYQYNSINSINTTVPTVAAFGTQSAPRLSCTYVAAHGYWRRGWSCSSVRVSFFLGAR